MDCSQLTELLSAYVDDALDPATKAGVEEHLAECRTCAADLASLRTYLEVMGSLPPVQAPVDFLASVHARLEQPGWFKRLLTWLFFPIKVKLPFEMTGLVAASVLLVLLYRGTEPEKTQFSPVSPAPTLQAPAVPAPPAPTSAAPVPSTAFRPSAEKSLEGVRPPAASHLAVEEVKKDEAPPVAAGPSSPAASAVPVEEPMKSAPAPLQERVEPPHASRLTPHAQTPTALQERTKSPALEPLSVAAPKPVELVLRLTPPADRQSAQKDVLREQQPAGVSSTTNDPQAQEQALARKVAPAPMRTTEKAEPTAPVSPATTIARIKALVEQAKGAVLSVDHEQHTQSPQAVAAQIPARNYSAFLHELRRLGQLEEPTAKPRLPNEDAMIQLRIRLIPPG